MYFNILNVIILLIYQNLLLQNCQKYYQRQKMLLSFRAGKDLNNYSVNFEKDQLFKHKKIGKLSSEDKEKLNVLFEKTNDFNKIEFKCVNCNFRKQINNSIKLYEIDFVDDNVSKFKSSNENKLLFNNPIYTHGPKTISCKNMNCITHKDTRNKEAVFYKDKKTNFTCLHM